MVGSKEFINKVVTYRKLLGGNLRQTGMLTAPALMQLQNYKNIITRDHQNAQYLAHQLNQIEGLNIDLK